MATSANARLPFSQRLMPNRLLAAASVVLLLAALLAVARGAPAWGRVPVLVWVHLASILLANGLTPVMLLRRKGDRPHRRLGYVWVGAMLLTAVTSLFFTAREDGQANLGIFSGDFSPIHLLSIFVLVQVPRIVFAARRHDRAGHESGVRGMVFGALLVAGFFTFPFDRMLGAWLFG